MSILRAASREVAGAWRSLRYDIVRRPGSADSPADGYPDVTSGGLSTFGGQPAEGSSAEYAQRSRPRRLLAAAAFVALVVAGAGGSYLAVVNGLGAIAAGQAAPPPDPLPLAGRPAAGAGAAPSGPASRPAAKTVPPVPHATAGPAPAGEVAFPAAPPRADRPVRPVPPAPPVPTPCRCPVPTPLPPASPAPSVSPSVSPSPSASGSPSPSAKPTESYRHPRGTGGY